MHFLFAESKRLADNSEEHQGTNTNSTSHQKIALADLHGQKYHRSDRLRGNMLAPRGAFGRIARYFNGSREAGVTSISFTALRSPDRQRNLRLHRHDLFLGHWLSDRSYAKLAGNHLHC